MSKSLVAFFSHGGRTAAVARRVAEAAGADLYEIVAEQPYTDADVDWRDAGSRTTLEGKDPQARPAISGSVADMDSYDVIYLGFPMWWYREPNIVDTFLDTYDLDGKTVVPFCTSGGSPVSDAVPTIAGNAVGATVLEGATLNGPTDAQVEALVAQAR
ncbi:flavodoxin [Caniella muris]|uniref:flavodoxin n=1 Tax=Caniella muris TaxID=2941502 RepID=UPI00203CB3A0|nr:flavodoxin [Caniella muris]